MVKNTFESTIQLPKTAFPMRANLAAREPERLRVWQGANVYKLMLEKNAGHPRFELHDGPPYANGPLHIGHALNKISKDIINRFWSMCGYETPFVPGWDCHGQPIEHAVEKALGTEAFHQMPLSEIRARCRTYAIENIELQRSGFQRLGVLGDWDHPYLTFDAAYDAADIEVFKRMWEAGAIYRGRKPVHWCKHCHTALAEAEIEYADEESPSIFVRLALTGVPSGLENFANKIDVMIWTTTPWTLPANVAVILCPDADYVALKYKGRAVIVAQALVERISEVVGCDPEIVEGWRATGAELVDMTYAHPIFADVKGRFIVADYVSLDDGTGIVHAAPGHGVDDYNAGMKFDLPVVMPVDDDGVFYQGDSLGSGGPFGGLSVDDANPKIIEWLDRRGVLVAKHTISHSYPHCWRCKEPVLFRATKQWFVSMDKTDLRAKALHAIHHTVTWHPARASHRIGSMVENRPDWCISRQRSWGVPIPVFTCADCGETVVNTTTLARVIELFRAKGSDAWFIEDPKAYLGDACVCAACGSHHLKPGRDILDVWWESGVSHTAVLGERDELSFPADLYLEGSDQHRGWFQSSLLTSVGACGVAPYRAVLSQGFVLDGKGRKMSKSLGNVIDPDEVCKKRGADIIRLWVASVDTSHDVGVDFEILDRVGEAYRRFRNTFRFLLGGLEGQFELDKDGVPISQLMPYDRLMLSRLCEVHECVSTAYKSYRFNTVYRTLYDFVVTELSNGYLNATKDRMYCSAPASYERRSAQTVWSYLLMMLVSDLQPILAYTTDEVLEFMPASLSKDVPFAALLNWWSAPMTKAEIDDLLPAYRVLLDVRSAFTKAYEDALASQKLLEKTTQAASAKITLPLTDYAALFSNEQVNLSEVLVCAHTEVFQGDELSVCVEPAEGERCARCWNWREVDGEELCSRCREVVDAIKQN